MDTRVEQALKLLGDDELPIKELAERFPEEDVGTSSKPRMWKPEYVNVYPAMEEARRRGLVDRRRGGPRGAYVYFKVPEPRASFEEVMANLRNSDAELPENVRARFAEMRREKYDGVDSAKIRRVGMYKGIPLYEDVSAAKPDVYDTKPQEAVTMPDEACPECHRRKGHAEGCIRLHPPYLSDDGGNDYVRADLHARAPEAAAHMCEVYQMEEAEATKVRMKLDPSVSEGWYGETEDEDGVPYWRIEFT